MNIFSIGDIENLTQIKAHTLRIWEQRYGICKGKRKNSLHRYYDEEDLKQILRIALLYTNGFKISHIARFSLEEIKEKSLGLQSANGSYGSYLNRLLESSIDLDIDRFEEIFKEAVRKLGFENTIIEIGFPFLNKIGLFWLTGHVLPAQEHISSAIITKYICKAIDQLPAVNAELLRRRVLLFTPPGEFHEISLLFMQFTLKKNGVPNIYMGKSTTIETLIEYCSRQPVSELCFQLITNLTKTDITEYTKQLAKTFPDKKIVCYGKGCIAISEPLPNVTILRNNEALVSFAKSTENIS